MPTKFIIGRRLRQGESCPEAGFFADATDCRKFYRCAEHETQVMGMPALFKFEFLCPVGTAFDDSISTCNYSYNVPNLPENCLTEAQAPPSDASETPVETENGSGSEQPKPVGEVFKPASFEGNNLIDNNQQGKGSKISSPPFAIFRPIFTVNPYQTYHVPQVYYPASNLYYSFKK